MNFEEMYKENEKLAYSRADKVFKRLIGTKKISFGDKEDVVQIAKMALWRAVQSFKPELGFAFSTYAVPFIDGSIINHYRDGINGIRVSREVEKITRAIRFRETTPTVDEIVKEFGCSIINADLALQHLAIGFVSMDKPSDRITDGGDDASDFANILSIDFDLEDTVIRKVEFERRLAILSEKAQKAIRLSLTGNYTQTQIGEILGVSQVQVSRLVLNGIKKIQEEFEIVAI